MRRHLIALIFLSMILGCSSSQKSAEAPKAGAPNVDSGRAAVKGLTREVAAARANVLSHVKYTLNFSLGAEEKEFSGTSEIFFNLKDNSKPLTIDFADGSVSRLSVNGANLPLKYNGQFITLPGGSLKVGENTVLVTFTHPYGTGGVGLHRFKDPEDKRVYLYSHFEPYDANKLFPCFDQPDLKAKFKVIAEVPSDWAVISSTREERVTPHAGNRTTWEFSESPLFSTYLISLHAGPYKVWKASAGTIPMRLFARQSLAKYIISEDWFKFTRQGLEYYGKFFDYPYPFKKYDQVIAPDFNMGAMENVAAITFSERYIRRGKPSQEERESLASVILHEMAHQWFGDLVTMRWWNDLWLNESFATIMSAYAVQDATEFKKSWQSFFIGEKLWAYTEDQYVTTHPIEATVPDTESAFATFDGITYGKGASVLKQVAFYIGNENFRNGCRLYFKKYQYGNAERKDFIGALEEASKIDLSSWTHEWLQTAGLNTVKAQYSCSNSKIDSFKLVQTVASGESVTRSHRTQIALLSLTNGKLKVTRVQPATYQASSEIKDLIGAPCPDAVFPNYGDFDYVKVSLDEKTLAAAKQSVGKIDDILTRMMSWASLWEMVRDAEFDAPAYSQIIFSNLKDESEYKIYEMVAKTVYGRRVTWPSLLGYLPTDSPENIKFYSAFKADLESFFWNTLQHSKPGSDMQKLAFDYYVKVASSVSAQNNLSKILKGQMKLPQFPIDQDRRWTSIIQLNAFKAQGAQDLTRSEKAKDPSNAGLLASIAADAIRPDLEVKKNWHDQILMKEGTRPFNQLRAAMRVMYPPEQKILLANFADDFFAQLPRMAKEFSDTYQDDFTSNLAPSLCTDASVKKYDDYLRGAPALTPAMMINLKQARQEDARCVRIRNLARTTIK